MSRSLLAGLPSGTILQALVPSCTALASLSWHVVGLGFCESMSSGAASTKRGRVLNDFADRLPDRLHPDDLHFLLKHLEGIPPPSQGAEAERSGTRSHDDLDSSSAVTGASHGKLDGDADTQPSSGSSEGSTPCRSTAGPGPKLNATTNSFSGAGSVGQSAGRSHSTATAAAAGSFHDPAGRYSRGSSSSDHQPGASRHRPRNESMYDDEYDHLHNIVFEQLQQHSRDHADSHVRVELYGTSPAGNRSGSSGPTSSSAGCRSAGPHAHHQSSGPGPNMGRGSHRRSRSWDRAWASYEDEDPDLGVDASGEHGRGHGVRRSRNRGGYGAACEDDDDGTEEGEWALGGGPAPNLGRTHRHRNRGDTQQNGSQQQQHRYQQQQQQQRRQDEDDPGCRQRSQSASWAQQQRQQQRQESEEQRRHQGRRGVGWFTKRWPRHYVDYREYAEFMAQEREREEAEWSGSGSAGGGRSRSKFYESAFTDDRDWFSQFRTNVAAAGSGSSSQWKESTSQSHSSQSAEQFTAGWWQRFQAAAAPGGGFTSWSSRAGASGQGSYQHQQAFGSGQRPHASHLPELRVHMSVLGLDLGAALDAATVKAAFRARAKETHPDLQHGADAEGRAAAEERFKAVQQAYHALSRAVGTAA